MKRILFSLCLLISVSVQAADTLLTSQPQLSNGTLRIIAGAHLLTAYNDPLSQQSSYCSFLCNHACRATFIPTASYIIGTEFANKFYNSDPFVKETCILCTDIALLTAYYECDKRLSGKPKAKKK